jgi:L-ascorbate metabolism protein UlaG (beta-lactamase superfamily)
MAYEYHRMIHIEPSTNRVDLRNGSVALLGDTTVLVDYGEIRLLLDPPVVRRAQTECLVPPDDIGIQPLSKPQSFETPDVDAIVLLEAPPASMEECLATDIPLIAPPSTVETLEAQGFERVHPLTTWQWIVLRKGDASITVTALPACAEDGSEEAAMGCMVELRSRPDQDPYRIYFSGPTHLSESVQEIAYRYPRIDLGLICLTSVMRYGELMAIDVQGAVDVACAINPDRIVPVHHLQHVFDWSRTDFHRVMHRRGHSESTVSLESGQPFWFEVANGPVPRTTAASRLGEPATRLSPGPFPTTTAGVLSRAR